MKMKNNIILIILILLFNISCQKVEQIESTSKGPALVKESGLMDFADIEKNSLKTWKDLDAYYKEMIINYKYNVELYNLKHFSIMMLVDIYHLLDDKTSQGTAAISYYCTELSTIPYANPKYVILYLDRLHGVWDNSKIKSVAKICFDKNMKLINDKSISFDPKNNIYDKETEANLNELKARFIDN